MTPRRMAWRFAVLFWTVFGLVSGFQIWIGMITHGHSVIRLVSYYVLVWEAWLAATAAIVWLARRLPVVPVRRYPILAHFLASCVIAVLHGFYWLGLMLVMRPFDWRTAAPSQVRFADFLFYRLPLEWLLYCLVLGGAMALSSMSAIASARCRRHSSKPLSPTRGCTRWSFNSSRTFSSTRSMSSAASFA